MAHTKTMKQAHFKPSSAAMVVAGLVSGAMFTQAAWAQFTIEEVSTKTASTKAVDATKKTVEKAKAKTATKVSKKPEAATSVVLSDIVVEGLQRSDPATVFNIIPVKIGSPFGSNDAPAVIKSLYGSGLYENVDVGLEGNILKIKLSERPIISDFKITGMKQYDKKALMASLKEKGFAQGLPYNPAILEQVKAELSRMYQESGMLAAKVNTEVTRQDRNQVAVEIKIDEGKNTKVRHIEFEGNKQVSTYTLRSAMELDTNGIFSWYTKDSIYSDEKLKADVEAIRTHYYDRGYLDFDFTNIAAKPTTHADTGVDLSFAVKEGEQFRVKSIMLVGDTQGTPRAEIEKLVKYNLGSVYSRDKISKIVEKVHSRLGVDGYALAQVDVQPKLNRGDNTVDVQLVVNPLARVYVRKINVVGNSRTDDEVIRREVRQLESALFNYDQVQNSRDRIDRLGYFENVAVDVAPVEGTDNQVDITYTVAESQTGSMSLSLGYNTSNSVTVAGSLTESNFLGSGRSLSIGIDTSEASRTAQISTTNPYFTKDGVSQSIGAYYSKSDQSKLDLSDTKITKAGVRLTYGIPVSERHRVFLGVNPEYNKIKLDTDTSPTSQIKFMDDYGMSKKYFLTYGLNLGWSYDTRDSMMMPSRGQTQSVTAEVAPFGDLKYYNLSYQYQQYVPLSKRFTLAFNTQFDYGKPIGKSAFPFYKNQYAGGLGSVRGYASGTVGPRELANENNTGGADNWVGGNKKVVANLEFQFPFPGMTKSKQARLFLFSDAAGVWGENKYNTFIKGSEGMRYSYGAGLVWNSPVGPLKFSYGVPINKKAGDEEERFQFQVGTSF